MRIVFAALLSLGLATAANADGLDCQTSILGGQSGIKDAATGASIAILPYAAVGEAVGGDYSVILTGSGDSYTYGRPPAVDLSGTEWTLATLNGQPAQERTTLAFQSGGQMGGMAPCNRYFGRYRQGDTVALTFSDIGATRRACPALSEEGAYFDVLGRTASFAIGREGDFLALLDAYGAELATFSRPGAGQPVDVTGRWNVTGVLIDGSVQSGPELSGVDMEFGGDGRFAAQLGCNTATGDFASDGRKLSFGTIAVTARQCFAPAPFERPILDALPLIRWVQAAGNGIALLDGDREALITLSR